MEGEIAVKYLNQKRDCRLKERFDSVVEFNNNDMEFTLNILLSDSFELMQNKSIQNVVVSQPARKHSTQASNATLLEHYRPRGQMASYQHERNENFNEHLKAAVLPERCKKTKICFKCYKFIYNSVQRTIDFSQSR